MLTVEPNIIQPRTSPDLKRGMDKLGKKRGSQHRGRVPPGAVLRVGAGGIDPKMLFFLLRKWAEKDRCKGSPSKQFSRETFHEHMNSMRWDVNLSGFRVARNC